jgi:WD40 repeat protein/tRNA A-37 threonylcarbamoyl transferase component Bud32
MPDNSPLSNTAQARFERVLAEMLEAEERGEIFDLSRVLEAAPELETPLREFLRNRDGFDRLAPQLAPVPTGPEAAASPPCLSPGSQFGDYEILGELGRGGMGVVYKARQRSLKRLVALKTVLAGQLADPEQVKRFQREAQAVARLEHPNIVPIYAVGRHNGLHYFSMKLIEGHSLSRDLPRYRGRYKATARLVARVARAVHFAHQRGILHRDLKPANILLDERKQPHVTDFGLAKRLDASGSLSADGDVIGTASYMAPEQAAARDRRLTPAADVYSLGAILYELLTGRPPFEGATVVETLWQVLDREPQPPRRLNHAVPRDLETICLRCLDKRPPRRYTSAAALAHDLERWAQGLPIQARRVGQAERAWLWCRRRPLPAGLAAAAVILALVAAGLGVGYHLKVQAETRAQERRNQVALEEEQERQRLAEETRKAEAGQKRQAELASEAVLDRDRQTALAQAEEQRRKEEERLRAEAEKEATRLRLEQQEAARKASDGLRMPSAKPQEVAVYLAAMRRAALLAEREQTDQLRLALDPFRPKAGQPDVRSWEWYFLHALQRGQEPSSVRLCFRRRINDVAQGSAERPEVTWGRHGRPLAVLDAHGDVQILDPATGKQLLTLANKVPAGQLRDLMLYRYHPIPVSPDGRWLVQVFRVRKGQSNAQRWDISINAKLWDLSTGTVAREFADVSLGVSWSPDARRLYLGGGRVWDMGRASEQRLKGHQQTVRCACWNAVGTRLATVSADHTIQFWDPVTGEEAGEPLRLGQPVGALAWSPGGKWLAVAAGENVSVWDMPARKQLWTLSYADYKNPSYRLTWSLDGQRLVVYGGGGAWPHKLIEGATGREIFTADSQAAYCPDGRRVAVLAITPLPGPESEPPSIRIMDTDTGQEVLRLGNVERGGLAWSPDGKVLSLAAESGILHAWRITPGVEPESTISLADTGAFAWSPDSLRIALTERNGLSRRIRIRTLAHPGTAVDVVPADVGTSQFMPGTTVGQILRLAWSPDGKYLATAHMGSSTIYLWEVASGRRTWRLAGHNKVTGGVFIERGNGIHGLAWAPGSRWLASAADNGTVKVWDTVTGKEACAFDLGEQDGNWPEVSWSSDGKYLAASGFGITRIWELPTGKAVQSLKRVGKAFMSPDRKWMALAVAGGVKLWDLASEQEVPPLEYGEKYLSGSILGWSPDGRFLAYSANGTCIWDVRERSRVEVSGRAVQAAWNPQGNQVLLGVGSVDNWHFKAIDLRTGKEVRDYGDVLVGVGAQRAPPQLLWTRDGPKLAMAHEFSFGPKGPRLVVQTAPHLVGEKSAEQGVVEVVDFESRKRQFTVRLLQDEPTQLVNISPLGFAWKPDGTGLATIHIDAVLRLWDPVTGRLLRRLSVADQVTHEITGPPYQSKAFLAWSPDSQRVACARNGTIEVWDLANEKKSQAFHADSRDWRTLTIQSLAWSPDNRRLAAMANRGQDVVVKVWDAATKQELRSYSLEGKASPNAIQLLCWSPDAKRLAAGVQSIHVWQAETGNDAFELSGHTVPLQRLEWSSDGRRIVSRAAVSASVGPGRILPRAEARLNPGSAIHELIVWDAEIGEQILMLRGAAAENVTSPDWNWLVVPSADAGAVRLQQLSNARQ